MMWRSRQSEAHDEALLAALGDRLRGIARSVEPRPEFRSSLRTSLVMEASTALVPDPNQPVPPVSTSRVLPRRRMVIATALVATSLGLGGMASASASALPGEALYPIKRATEQVELTFHRDLADRGAFQLELAERRLREARELSERGDADLAAESVREFEETAAAGTADLMTSFREDDTRAGLVVLNRFTTRTEVLLSTLAAQLPPEATAAVDDARESLATIADRSEQMCPTCDAGSGGGASPPPGSDYSADPGSSAPEPDIPPSSDPPTEPPAPSPPFSAPTQTSSTVSDDESEDEDDDDDESEEDESEDEDAKPHSPGRTPEPTPSPTPAPSPSPSPTPTPDPTQPGVPGLLNNLLDGTLDGLF